MHAASATGGCTMQIIRSYKMCHSGPSEEQFKQHREHGICSKLNPNRVGANFYKEKHNMTGDSWGGKVEA